MAGVATDQVYRLQAELHFPTPQMRAEVQVPRLQADLRPIVRVGEHIQFESYPFTARDGRCVIQHGMGTRRFSFSLWNERGDTLIANVRAIDGNSVEINGLGRDMSGTADIVFKRK